MAHNSLTPNQLARCMDALWPTRQPIFLFGPPGIGKSAIPRQFAKANNLEFVDLRLVSHLPTDFKFPIVDSKRLAVHWINSLFPTKRSNPDWKGIIMLDEFSQAGRDLQTIALEILRERTVGSEVLPDGAWVLAAGNRPEDGTAAFQILSSAMTRVIAIELEVDAAQDGAWHTWARAAGVHTLIRSFLAKMPDRLMQFDPALPGSQATPRTWGEQAHHVVSTCPKDLWFQLLAGSVGSANAGAFMAFVEIYDRLPDPWAAIKNPGTYSAPNDLNVLYASVAALAVAAKDCDKSLVGNFALLADRMPKEFGVLLMMEVFAAHPWMVQGSAMPAAVRAWLKANKSALEGGK